MYKIGSFEQELYESMSKNLSNHRLEDKFGFDKLAKAINFLNEAAIIFDKAGMQAEAKEVLEVLQKLASDIKQ